MFGEQPFGSGPSGIPGVLGEPLLTGSGDLTPGSLAGFTLSCTNAQPFAQGYIFVSFSSAPIPFFGGTFYCGAPIAFQRIFPFNGAGAFTPSTALDNSIPNGISIYLQFFFSDATAPQGVSGSNGLRMDVP